MSGAEARLLTSNQVVEMTGVSYRRLDFWVRRGLVRPAVGARGSGSQRLWAPEDVDRVIEIDEAYRCVIRILAEAGLPTAPYVHGDRRRAAHGSGQNATRVIR
jgi:hypothetical protein